MSESTLNETELFSGLNAGGKIATRIDRTVRRAICHLLHYPDPVGGVFLFPDKDGKAAAYIEFVRSGKHALASTWKTDGAVPLSL